MRTLKPRTESLYVLWAHGTIAADITYVSISYYFNPTGLPSPILSVNNFQFYTIIAIEFVLHHNVSAILVIKVLPNFMDVQHLPTGLQHQ